VDAWSRVKQYAVWSSTKTYRQRLEIYCGVGRDVLSQIPASVRPLCIDLGCGPGMISFALAELGFDVIGVDSSPPMIAEAEAHAVAQTSENGALSFRNQDLEGFLDEFEGLADFIVCSSVLEYLPDPVGAIGAMGRRLRVGGTLAVSLPNHRSLVRRAVGITHALRLPWGRYMTLWANRIGQEDLVEGGRSQCLTPVQLRHFGFPSFAPVLKRVSEKELVGTLTLFLFRK
jgi:SAM-dependent methyltransferase